MLEVRAPLKVILFGEHAVVYNRPCIAMAINKYVRVKVKKRNDSSIIIRSKNFGIELRKDIDNIYDNSLPYVTTAIEEVFKYLDTRFGIEIEIETEAPISSGLGSSAAVSVSTIYSILKIYGYEPKKREVSNLAYNVELKVQGKASRTDTYISTHGGIHFIRGNNFERINSKISLVILDSGVKRSTRLLVNMVKRMYEKDKKIVDKIFDTISEITFEARNRIERNEDISDLMNMNHGLLYSLGLSNKILERYRFEMLKSGCYGVKMTGAGGGGCLIGYRRDYNYESVLKSLRKISKFVAIVSTENHGVVALSEPGSSS